jgi:two-component system sensor histidine kinase and response regulator WspE
MLELFQAEVDGHAQTLKQCLAGLGAGGSKDSLSELRRAAHSLKGAARIVGLDEIAGLAHSMEDCAQSAGSGQLAGEPARMLMTAGDFIFQAAQCPADEINRWLDTRAAEIVELAQKISSIASHAPVPAAPAAEPAPVIEIDLGMFDMFRTEAEGHAASMNEGLLSLETASDSRAALNSLMRAAHSIKGAARMVGIEDGVTLAHTMEDYFIAAEKGRVRVDSVHVDVLLQAADMFSRLSQLPDNDVANWLGRSRAQFSLLAGTIEAFLSEPAPAQAAPPAATSATDAPPDVEPIDASMLDMFRMEVESHAATLNDGLLALETSPSAKESLQSLMCAAHSIKGAARIVGIELGVKLAHAMEDCFIAAQEEKIVLNADGMDLLLKAVDLFSQLAQAETSEGATYKWLVTRFHEFNRVSAAIQGLIEGGGVVPPSQISVPPFSPAPSATDERPSQPPLSQASMSQGPPTLMDAGAAASPATLNRQAARNRVVRVSADNLNRLLGLAGEALVETRWHGRFAESMMQLKRQQSRLRSMLRQIRRVVESNGLQAELDSPLVEAERRATECSRLVVERLGDFERFSHRADTLSQRLYRETVQSRMRPFDDGMQGFPRLVRDLARQLKRKVVFKVEGGGTEVDRDVLERLEAPLNHLIRNALDHGLETPDERAKAGKAVTGVLKVEARHRAGALLISVSDDGRGVNMERLKAKILERKLAAPEMVARMTEAELLDFLFLPGFSTAKEVTEVSGRGVGLDVVQTMVQESGGSIRISTKAGQGTAFNLQLPITLSVLRVMLVEVGGDPLAVPLSRIDRLMTIEPEEIKSLEGRQFVSLNGENIGLVLASQVLESDSTRSDSRVIKAVVVSDRANRYGLVVSRFLGETELVVRPLDPRLGKIPAINAAAILEDGSPVAILDIDDLVRLTDNLLSGEKLRRVDDAIAVKAKNSKRVLVIDDSFTVRETERKLLQRSGYEVKTAVDGMEGWNAVRSAKFDLVISDVDMPRMNGIEFVRKVKSDERLKAIPVIIVSYKDREEDRLKGLEAGANYYLTKSSFQDDTLVKAVQDLIGEA